MLSTDSRAGLGGKISLTIWIFLATLGVRLLVLTHFSSSPHFLPTNGDEKFYNDWALRILKGQWTDHQAFYGLPGYPFFLAGIYSVTGFSPFLVGLLQITAEAVTSVVIFKIAMEVFTLLPDADPRNPGTAAMYRPQIVGALAAMGWALFQPAQTFSVILMPTCWLILLFWSCVLWILKMRTFSAWYPWLWLGLILGLFATMIATILFLIPLIIAAIIILSRPVKEWNTRICRVAAAIALLFGGVIAGASPCWLHNYFLAGEPVFLSAHSGVNFYIGNNPLANGYPKIPPGLRAGQEGMLKDSITMAEAAAGHKLKRAEVSRFWSDRAKAYIHDHFGDWLRLMALKFKNFWNAFQYDDLSLITLFEQDGILTPGFKFGFVAALAIPGIFIGAWKYPRSRWVVAAVLLHMAALMPVFITERYRMAAVPGMLIMAAIGLWEFWNFLATTRWGCGLAYTAATAVSVLFVAQPPSDQGLWSLDYYNTGIKAIQTGDLARAQRDLSIAIAYVPENSEINFALGNLALEKGDRMLAKQYYLRTIEINGRHSSAYNNLGVLAMEEKFWKTADAFFNRSLWIEPDDAKTHYLLAKVKLELKDTAAAKKEIHRALELKPEQPEFQTLGQEIDALKETPAK
ncbi:MAG: tetratricopeptide repeat protein [Chthoniobacteraceae bacterium]